MGNWFRYFLGTPRRFMYTAIGVLVIAGMIDPMIPARIVNRFAMGIEPMIGPILLLGITFYAMRVMLRPLLPGGRRRRR